MLVMKNAEGENGIFSYQTPEAGTRVMSLLIRYAEYSGIAEP